MHGDALGGGGDDSQRVLPRFAQVFDVSDAAAVSVQHVPRDLGGAHLIDDARLVVVGDSSRLFQQGIGGGEGVAPQLDVGLLGRRQNGRAGYQQA